MLIFHRLWSLGASPSKVMFGKNNQMSLIRSHILASAFTGSLADGITQGEVGILPTYIHGICEIFPFCRQRMGSSEIEDDGVSPSFPSHKQLVAFCPVVPSAFLLCLPYNCEFSPLIASGNRNIV